MSEKTEDLKLLELLKKYGKAKCPKCDKTLSRDDCEWGGGFTEAGTDYCTLKLTCSDCNEVIVDGSGWGFIENFIDYLEELEDHLD